MPTIFNQFNIDAENLPVLLGSGISFLIVLSFAIYRLVAGEINLALVDFAISAILFILFFQAWRSRCLKYINMLLVITYMGGFFAVLHLKGAELLFWIYPAIAATYFLQPCTNS